MTLLAFLLVARQAALPTPEQVLRNINGFFASAQHYSDVWDLRTLSEDGKPVHIKMHRKIDGKRFYFATEVDEKPAVDLASNGTTGMLVNHANRQYFRVPSAPEVPEFKVPTDVETDKVMFQFQDRSLLFWANPELNSIAFDTQKIGDQTFRHYVAEAPRKAGRGKVHVELLVYPDQWIVRKLDITTDLDGKPERTLHLEAITVNSNATFTDKDFIVPPSVYSGYDETLPGGN